MTTSLDQVNQSLKKKFGPKKLIFGSGHETARIVFVTEPPGTGEEEAQKPITGPSEKLLNKLLRLAGINKRKVYLTNVVKYSAPTNRPHTAKELKASIPFLKEELKMIKPDIVVTLGNTALNGIGLRQPLHNVHGKVFNLGTYELIPTFHLEHAQKDSYVASLLAADFMKIRDHLKFRSEQPKDGQDETL